MHECLSQGFQPTGSADVWWVPVWHNENDRLTVLGGMVKANSDVAKVAALLVDDEQGE